MNAAGPRARLLAPHGRAALPGDWRRAAQVGRAYLRLVPEEGDLERLVTLIAEQVPDFATRAPDAAELRRGVARSVQEDFANGRVTRVQGWVLSRTEARLAALAALS